VAHVRYQMAKTDLITKLPTNLAIKSKKITKKDVGLRQLAKMAQGIMEQVPRVRSGRLMELQLPQRRLVVSEVTVAFAWRGWDETAALATTTQLSKATAKTNAVKTNAVQSNTAQSNAQPHQATQRRPTSTYHYRPC